jgi:AraC family transcriptional regulator of adaptative response / DNA-3-methyladenine glycosylase II
VKAATTVFGRFAQFFGEPVETPFVGLDRTAPSAATLADARLDQIIERGLTRKRAETIKALARAVADGRVRLDATSNAADTALALDELPGIGPWTIQYIAMRALRDPDAFPASDLGLLKALALQHPKKLAAVAETWRPWRAYAAIHLWHSLSAGG